MKTRVLILIAVFAAFSLPMAGQGMYIDWDEATWVEGSEMEDALKINGTLHNADDYAKRLQFTYEMDEIAEGHSASLCFGLNCFFLFEGDGDKPELRNAQDLPASGTERLLADVLPFGIQGQSNVKYCIFDSANVEDRTCFVLNYAAGVDIVSVVEAQEIGLSVGPNPATDRITVRGDQAVNIEGANLYSVDGNIVRTYAFAPSETQTFTLNGIAPGTYQLLLTMGEGRTVRASVVVVR